MVRNNDVKNSYVNSDNSCRDAGYVRQVVILLGCFMTCIGKIEYIILLLRVKHQCVLVGTFHSAHQLLDQSLSAVLSCSRSTC